jgi:hypothetical protein
MLYFALLCGTTLAYYTDSVVVVNAALVGLDPVGALVLRPHKVEVLEG